jgi:D-glycero-D-manno-heptose 1,7-bisphosphate phosphatase
MMNKAVFIDKDGTLVYDVPYNVNPDLIQLQEGAVEALQLLQKYGYRLFVISNQSGVARGLFTENDLEGVKDKLQEELCRVGVTLDGFYFCPHHPGGIVDKYNVQCACRKPAPGMILQAAAMHDIALSQSWMIGDILDDVEAGNRAGCRSILINNGNETRWEKGVYRHPSFTVKSILEAARMITLMDRYYSEHDSRLVKYH